MKMEAKLEKKLTKMDVKLDKMHCNMQRSRGSSNDVEGSEEKDETTTLAKEVPKDAESAERLGSD
jgi:hypothetical protein